MTPKELVAVENLLRRHIKNANAVANHYLSFAAREQSLKSTDIDDLAYSGMMRDICNTALVMLQHSEKDSITLKQLVAYINQLPVVKCVRIDNLQAVEAFLQSQQVRACVQLSDELNSLE